MIYYAVTVFVVAYAFIISERFNKTRVALVAAGLMVCLPVIDSPDVFYSQDNGIDWDVIFLMLGMMMIVSILRQTGVFEYVAIWAVKRQRLTVAHHAAADGGDGAHLGRAAQHRFGIAHCPGHLAGLRCAGHQPGTAVDGRGVRLQRRGCGDSGRRPAEHHHRRPQSVVVQRLSGQHGGNLTAVGSSANIVMLGIALRSGNPISFWEFTRKGIVITTISTALCAVYLWLRYFVLA
jgi:hypothetical protein